MPYCCFSSSLHTLEFRNGSSSVSGAFVVVVVGYQYTIGGGSSTTSSNSSSTSGFNRASVIHPMVAEGITSVKGNISSRNDTYLREGATGSYMARFGRVPKRRQSLLRPRARGSLCYSLFRIMMLLH